MSPKQKIADRIRSRRETLGLTQGEVGQSIGVHKVQMHRIEAGKRDVSLQEAVVIARVLMVPLAWLVGDDEVEPEPTGIGCVCPRALAA